MEIAVCIKQVPENPEVRMEEGRWILARQDVPSRINPYDLEALEIALGLVQERGGSVSVLCMGPPQAEEALREALAMGAQRAILISDPALAGSDTLATSHALASAIKRLVPAPELILCGARSTDSDTAQVPPQIAEELGLPHASYALEVEVLGRELRVLRRMDRQLERLRMAMPALVSVLKAPRRPREIPLGAIHTAFEARRVSFWGLSHLGLDPREVGLAGSATVVRSILEPPARREGKILDKPPHEAVEAILEALREHHVIS